MALPRRAASSLSRRLVRPQQRRFAGHNAHGHHNAEPVNESFGLSFYGTVAMIPTTCLLWSFSQGSTSEEEPFLSKLLHRFDSWQEEFNQRNYHNALLSKIAADDRILFQNSGIHPTRRKSSIDNIESLNTFSPYNVQPGWGSINLEKLVEHLEKENAATDEENVQRYQKRVEAGFYQVEKE